MAMILENEVAINNFQFLTEMLEDSIIGYNLGDCIRMVKGNDAIYLHNNIHDEILIFRHDVKTDIIYYYRGASKIPVATKQKIKKLISSELIYTDEDKCTRCKVGCFKQ